MNITKIRSYKDNAAVISGCAAEHLQHYTNSLYPFKCQRIQIKVEMHNQATPITAHLGASTDASSGEICMMKMPLDVKLTQKKN